MENNGDEVIITSISEKLLDDGRVMQISKTNWYLTITK